MADERFTQEELGAIVDLLKSATHVTALSLTWANGRLRLSRNAAEIQVDTDAGAPAEDTIAAAPARQLPATPDKAVVRSRTVGTFYRAAATGAAPYVEIGATVEPDTVIGQINVIRQAKPVAAETAGRVNELLANDGQPVEYGQPLAVITRTSATK